MRVRCRGSGGVAKHEAEVPRSRDRVRAMNARGFSRVRPAEVVGADLNAADGAADGGSARDIDLRVDAGAVRGNGRPADRFVVTPETGRVSGAGIDCLVF